MCFSLLRDILFPIECLGCQKPGAWVCQSCFRKLQTGSPTHRLAINQTGSLDQIYIAGDYDDPLLAELIKKYKYNFITDLEKPLSDFLAFYWAGQIAIKPELGQATLVPVPLSKKRERWRGFNQADLLANSLSVKLGLKKTGALKRLKNARPQSSLSGRDRLENIKGAFKVNGQFPVPRQIILVDDVVTTGATLEEAAATLKAAGVKRVSALVIAKG